ncbi:MAG: hypothetical protein DME25_21095, partial [Verrucomicrobia bacterium]
QDGKLLFEMGKLDEAEKILKQVVREDPQNQAAYYYLNLINGARYTTAIKARDEASRAGLVEVAQEWATPPKRELLPIPNPFGRTNLIFTGKGRQAIAHKLDIIRLDNVNYDGLPLGEVIKTLSDEAKKRDPEKRGLNFILNPNVDTGGGLVGQVTDPTTGQLVPAVAPAEAVDMTSIGIKLSLSDVRLADVLDAVVKVADKPIKYSVEEYAVVFSLKSREPVPLYLRVFKVDPNTFYQGLQSVGAFVFGETSATSGGGGGGGGEVAVAKTKTLLAAPSSRACPRRRAGCRAAGAADNREAESAAAAVVVGCGF